MHEAIEDTPADFFCDIEEEELSELSDQDYWDEAYRQIEDWFYTEMMNLDVKAPGKIILIGTMERWNGSFSAYKELGTDNIGEALEKAVQSFDGDNIFEAYCESDTGKMLISQTGHDNPTNPSVFEFRALKVDMYDLDDDSQKTLLEASEPIGRYAADVYGWEMPAVCA